MNKSPKKPHPGTSLKDFLKEEGMYDECHNQAIKEVLAWQISEFMKQHALTKAAMAERMNTSRAALNRLLDVKNTSVTLHTLINAAAVIGKKLKLELI